MQIIENSLYIEFSEALNSGVSENTLKSAGLRNSPSWKFLQDPMDKRKVLICYEKMPPRYKEMIEKRFGNPYEYVAKEPIRKLVKRDLKANDYYLQYRFDGVKAIPIDKVHQYTAAAEWLNMLIEVGEDKKTLKKLLNLSIGEFWLKVCEIIVSDNIALPSSYKRLNEKIKTYKESGYQSLIHGHFGNTNSLKVNSEVSEAMLLEMINHHNQHDDVYIAWVYKNWAIKTGHKPISAATVGNWRRDNAHLITANREGNSISNERFTRQSKGYRPSQPLYLVEHDDNNLDFLFRDPDDKTDHKYFHRYVSICVTDSYCDLLLGKCYIEGKTPENWMVKAAYIDAMYYIRKLTGAWHLPFEIKADRWRKTQLYPFYEKIAKFIEPAKANKHRGYIEPFFGSPFWKRAQKVGNDNWSGNNLTAPKRGVNMELFESRQSMRPTVGQEAEQQIENFFHRLRRMPDVTRNNMNAPCKEEKWLARWNELPDDKKKKISDEQFLSIFGFTHNPDTPIKITNRGIEPQIAGRKYSYDLPMGTSFTQFIGAKVNVIYDPYDMSRVLITNHEDIRFIASSATLQPRALADQYAGSRSQLNEVLESKRAQIMEVITASEKRKSVLQKHRFDAEALLMGGVMSKELKNAAEYAYQLPAASNNNDEDYDPMNGW